MGYPQSLSEYSTAGFNIHSSVNQRILSELVSREVVCNVSYLVSDVYKLVSNADRNVLSDTSFDQDEMMELMVARADPKSACAEAGYSFLETEEGWYWFDSSSPQPFGDLLPDNYFIASMKDDDGTTIWCYYYKVLDDDDWEQHGAFCEKEARQLAWQSYCSDNNMGPELDQDDAANLCVDENRIELSDYDAEVYEHWAVSSFFARKLQEQGDVVKDFGNLDVWGRTCSGQAISLDFVIANIAFNMGILDGLEHSWAKKDEA